jgi:energy-coupling factor transporter ATP-binding protein EcfA2
LTKSKKNPEPLVELRNVSYQYPKQTAYALSNANLKVHKGEFLGVIGPTGAGKTTLCLALNGIVPQFYGGRFFGSLRVGGFDTVKHPTSEFARHVGMVFEDPETQLISMSVENEIAFALENLKYPREIILERIQSSLASVRLTGTEKKHPHELSGGQKQRLAIAAAIAIQPDLLVLDEPTSQLDPVGAEEVFQTIRDLNREHEITIFMTSHSAEEMAAYADRIAVISGGDIIAIDTPDEIYSGVETLRKHHLRPPQVTSTFYQISKGGIHVPKLPVRMEDASPILDGFSMQELGKSFNPVPATKVKHKPILEIRSLSHIYPDGTEAIKDITLEIFSGESVLIIGQNGAGKSTLIKHFVNLLTPTSGIVKFDGTPTSELSMSDLSSRIGFISQNPDNQIFNKTVEEEISYAMKLQGFDQAEQEARTSESLEAMGLTKLKDQHPLSLSKGDRARVVIGAILAMKPELLIFDEPTTGQDFLGAKRILEITRRLHENLKTIIIVTHHLYLMPEYAERVIVMGEGTILLDDNLRTAFHDIDTLRRTFIKPPQAVQISQELIKRNPSYPLLLTPEEIANYLIQNKIS